MASLCLWPSYLCAALPGAPPERNTKMKFETRERNDPMPYARLIEGQASGNDLCASAQEYMLKRGQQPSDRRMEETLSYRRKLTCRAVVCDAASFTSAQPAEAEPLAPTVMAAWKRAVRNWRNAAPPALQRAASNWLAAAAIENALGC